MPESQNDDGPETSTNFSAPQKNGVEGLPLPEIQDGSAGLLPTVDEMALTIARSMANQADILADETATDAPHASSPNVTELLQAHIERLDAVTSQLTVNEQERVEQRRLRETLYEKLDETRHSFQMQLLKPWIHRVAATYDLTTKWESEPPRDPQALIDCLLILRRQIKETMEICGIQTVSPEPGDRFDRRLHFVVDTRNTGDVELNERIVETLQHGFVYFVRHEKTGEISPFVIRPARVITWKHDPGTDPLPSSEQNAEERGDGQSCTIGSPPIT